MNLVAESFDNVTAADLLAKYQASQTSGMSFTTGRTSNGVGLGTGNSSVIAVLPSGLTEIFIGVALKHDNVAGATNGHYTFQSAAASELFTIQTTMSGALQVCSGTTGGTVLATSAAGLILSNTWFQVQVRIVVSTTVGVVTIYHNGVQVATATGLNTGSTAIQRTGPIRRNNGNLVADDWYVNDSTGSYNNGFLGDVKIACVLPNADGTTNNWTATGAANRYQCVDETTRNDDTDYVVSSTPGDVQLFGLQDITLTGQVLAVVATVWARKDDAGTRTVKLRLKSGATSTDGPDTTMNLTYQPLMKTFDTDPNTGSPFTVANFNAAEVGAVVVA